MDFHHDGKSGLLPVPSCGTQGLLPEVLGAVLLNLDTVCEKELGVRGSWDLSW